MVTVLLVGPPLIIGVGGFLLVLIAMFPRTGRRTRETFCCPWTQRIVTAEFLVLEGASHPAEVLSCTGFPEPRKITCTKSCRDFTEVGGGLTVGGVVT